MESTQIHHGPPQGPRCRRIDRGPTGGSLLAEAGFLLTVIERFPGRGINGQSIDIRTTGVTVMRTSGMQAGERAGTVQTREQALFALTAELVLHSE